MSFSLLGFIIGIWAEGFEKLQIIPLLIITPLTFLGGSFYSINVLPPIWQTMTLFNPVVYLVSVSAGASSAMPMSASRSASAMTLFVPRALPHHRVVDFPHRLQAEELGAASADRQRRMTTATQAFDVIILGAGAAGLMCALTAGQRGRKVLLLDHADKVGAKILISGGGRCNFTNLDSAPDRFLSGNPDFCRSALGRYTQADFIALIERHGIAYHEKTLGQLFCDGSARAVVAMLLAECAQGGVDVRVGYNVTDISRADGFRVETSHGCFTAPALVLATGGAVDPENGRDRFRL